MMVTLIKRVRKERRFLPMSKGRGFRVQAMKQRSSDKRAVQPVSASLPGMIRQLPRSLIWYTLSRAGDHGRLPPFRHLTQLTQHVYLGGQVSRRGWRRLQKWGIGAIVNMRVEWDDRRSGIEATHSLWLPTIDGTPSTVEQLVRGASFIHEQVVAQRPVYIHCAGGLGRAPTMALAYLIARGHSIKAATALVKGRRPFITLSPQQIARLTEFERYIKARGINYTGDETLDPVDG